MNKTLIAKLKRVFFCLTFCCGNFIAANAQYYYKDIITSAQISNNYRILKANKVSGVNIRPVNPGADAKDAVFLQQTLNAAQRSLITYTKTPDDGESWLTSVYDDKDRLVASADSSKNMVSRTRYTYDADGRLTSISNQSTPVNDPAEKEIHLWTYNANGQPQQMLKIKNNTDTTVVSFITDEHGDAGEEQAVHKKLSAPSIYYYYDDQHRLTDVTRFIQRANRILPYYMFEYNEGLQISQTTIVPEGSNEYKVWKYNYEANGLKKTDVCYNKQKQVVGGLEYNYTFGK